MQIVDRNLDPYENLANAIIMQAVDDFRKAHGACRNDAMIAEVRRYFKGEWVKHLTKADPLYILQKLEEEFE